MGILEIINRKKANQVLTFEEINFVVQNFTKQKIPSYQMAAFLMAVFFQGLNTQETFHLTKAMVNSGPVLDLSKIKGIKVDKHSTGGVGDKTTLVLCPLLATFGLKIAKMSGRGLGFTGGTIDKLESIDNFSVELSQEKFVEQVNSINIAVVSQSSQLVPADKHMYSLRDVTGTVDSLPLIASSIMSKKIATGSDIILLDVKCGQGAFMQNLEEAEKLAKLMVQIGKMFTRKVRIEITSMDQPLGFAIGNKNEVLEAIETLQGNGPQDFQELIFSSAATVLLDAKITLSERDAKEMVRNAFRNQRALVKFKEWVSFQNGDVKKLFSPGFWNPKHQVTVKAWQNGYVNFTKTLNLGLIAMQLGAGRQTKEDQIDFEAGINLHAKNGCLVKEGQNVLTLSSSKPIPSKLVQNARETLEITNNQVKKPVILKKVG